MSSKNTFILYLDFGNYAKPIGQVNDAYHEPLTLEFPESDSVHSLIESSQSSGRSSPSSLSTANLDSEGDFARLAENLALKTDAMVCDIYFKHYNRSRFKVEKILCIVLITFLLNSKHIRMYVRHNNFTIAHCNVSYM